VSFFCGCRTSTTKEEISDRIVSRRASSTYVPVLDGIRAISIVMVLFSHSTINRPMLSGLHVLAERCGQTGVAVFFVISGYLITMLLLREEDKTGRIHLKKFYVRRALRLFPACYVYLAIVALLSVGGWVAGNPPRAFVASIFYFRNLAGQGYETTHLWSLSLEEQFYLLWPTLLFLIPARLRLRITIGTIVAICLWRTYVTFTTTRDLVMLGFRSDLRMDTILVGCAMALSRARTTDRRAIPRGMDHGAFPVAVAATLVTWIALADWHEAWFAPGPTVVALLISLILGWFLDHTDSAAGRLLSCPPAIAIGGLSYSLYLWQQLFLAPWTTEMGAVRQFPIDLVLTFAAAWASYRIVEMPFLRIKDRYFRA
jgi:peptidoglycan/LPS O-acetylase OafA/YrhL